MDGKLFKRQVILMAQSAAETMILISNISDWLGIKDSRTYNRVRLHFTVAYEYANRSHIIEFGYHPSYINASLTVKRYSNLFNPVPVPVTIALAAQKTPVPTEQISVEDTSWTAGTSKMLCEVIAEILPDNTLPPTLP